MGCIQLRGYQQTLVVEQGNVLSAFHVRMHHCCGAGQSCKAFYNGGTYMSLPLPLLVAELPTEVLQIDRLPQLVPFLLPSFEKRGKRV